MFTPMTRKICGEVLIVGVLGVIKLEKGGLVGNKGGHLVVGKASGEGWDILAERDGAHGVDGLRT